MNQTKKLGQTTNVSAALTTDQRKMLERLAREKFKCPQSLTHAVRMMIEEVYYEWEMKNTLKEIERDGTKPAA